MAIRYPSPLRPGDRIGVTAPSSGIGKDLQGRLDFCIDYLLLGYPFHCPKLLSLLPLPHPLWHWQPLTPSSSGAVLLRAVKWITRIYYLWSRENDVVIGE